MNQRISNNTMDVGDWVELGLRKGWLTSKEFRDMNSKIRGFWGSFKDTSEPAYKKRCAKYGDDCFALRDFVEGLPNKARDDKMLAGDQDHGMCQEETKAR